MQCTDACVFPYPGGDSSLRRMALLARELGFDSLVAAGSAGGEAYGVEIVGMKVPGGSKEGEGQPPHCGTGREGRTITVARAGDYNANRAVLRSGKVKVLRGIQCTPRNSFDHILSRIAAEKCIAVDIDMSSLTSGGASASVLSSAMRTSSVSTGGSSFQSPSRPEPAPYWGCGRHGTWNRWGDCSDWKKTRQRGHFELSRSYSLLVAPSR